MLGYIVKYWFKNTKPIPKLTQRALDKGWSPPYAERVNVTEVITAEKIKFMRVHKDPHRPTGEFLVREKEIRHILNDPKALQAYLALPYEPAYITEVVVPANTRLRIGLIAPQPNFGVFATRGRFQYELLIEPPEFWFKNTKPILKFASSPTNHHQNF